MCRAHGIPHQKVARPADLAPALRSAWDLNRHSVVEVVTSRETNVEQHRAIQATVRAAVLRALHAIVLPPPLPEELQPRPDAPPPSVNGSAPQQSQQQQTLHPGSSARTFSGNGSMPPPEQQQQQAWAGGMGSALPSVQLRPALVIQSVCFQRYSLPLLKPLTTGVCSHPPSARL